MWNWTIVHHVEIRLRLITLMYIAFPAAYKETLLRYLLVSSKYVYNTQVADFCKSSQFYIKGNYVASKQTSKV